MSKVYVSGVLDVTPMEPAGIWGGGNVPMPTPPIHIPGLPPSIWGPPTMPPGFWGGGMGPGVGPQPGVPTHPIYIPVTPPPESGLAPEHPIYIPIYPAHPIALPPGSLTEEQKQKLASFLTGNLPPYNSPQPVKTPPKA